MANTPNFNLYKPNRADNTVEVDVSLADNFTKIDTELQNNKGGLAAHITNPNAHTSENISHSDGSVKSTLENHEVRIGNAENMVTDLGGRVTNIETLGLDVLAPNLEGRIQTIESDVEGFLAPATFDAMDNQSYTFDEYRIGYVNNKINDIMVNVKSFGAKGDGLTDDTALIQEAIDYVYGLGGGTVVLPSSGTFIFTSILVKTNVRFKSYGSTLKLKDNTCVDTGVSYYLVHNMGHTNVVYDGLVIDGNRANNTSFLVADGITAVGGNITIKDCYIYDVPDSGIMFSGVTNGLCTNNRIKNGGDVGVYVNDGVNGTVFYESVISNNRITDFPNGGIALKRVTQRTIVESNTIYNCGNGITLEQASTTTDYSKNISILNNRMRTVGTGIILRGSDYSQASNNRIEEFTAYGVLVEGSKYCTVTNNVINTTTFVDNTFNGGIILQGRANGTLTCDYNVVEGNIIEGNMIRGIRLSNASTALAITYNIVAKNIVKSLGTAFRIDASAANNNVSDNILNGVTYDMDYRIGATKNILANNRLVNGLSVRLPNADEVSYLQLYANTVGYTTAAPTTGTWTKGDRIFNSNPVVGQPKSWVCTVAGTPGTWVSEGNL